jgi:hypothetical protein
MDVGTIEGYHNAQDYLRAHHHGQKETEQKSIAA